jgi:type II secretory pathway pseudopilin PulG
MRSQTRPRCPKKGSDPFVLDQKGSDPFFRRSAFTLIELFVILGLLLFFLGLVFGFVLQVGRAAGNAQTRNNLMQMALALHSANDTYKSLPPITGAFPGNAKNHGTLHFHILPFIEQGNLYQRAEGQVWKNGTYGEVIRVYLDARDKSAPPDNKYQGWLATTNYAANWMVFKQGGASIPRTFRDGTSNTFVFSERYQMCNGTPSAWGYASLYYWAPMFAYYSKGKFQLAPTQDDCDPALAQAIDKRGIHAAMGDGSARFVSPNVSPQTWWFACDPADGNPLGDDF